MSKVDSIAIYVCTHKRNKPLTKLLESLKVSAKKVQPEIEVAVIVVDDNPEGIARVVYDQFKLNDPVAFTGGLHYVFSGKENISLARNAGLEKGLSLANWIAMVDDDQVVVEDWLTFLVATQAKYSADAVTGPVFLRYSQQAPNWLHDEPFAQILEATPKQNGQRVELCSTGNSMISSEFLRENPTIRFRQDLGQLGGEDMVFFRTATQAGLKAVYSLDAICYGEQPINRSNLIYQLRTSCWMGNTEFITNIETGSAKKTRLFLRSTKRLLSYFLRPFKRIAVIKNPQLRFMLAGFAQSFGIYAGILGIRIKHPS